MVSSEEQWVPVATARSEQRAAELGLVLAARDIEHVRRPGAAAWELWVRADDARRAAAELAEYLEENTRAAGPRKIEAVGDGRAGAVAYAALLLAVFVCIRGSVFGLDWFGAGLLDAGRTAAGEWWRPVTALTVHFDLDHVGGNLAFGAFFGYFVGHYLGRGIGWLSILASGVLANVAGALLEPAEHRSFGASTAVFAALGILTAYTWRRGFLRETPWRARIAPIVAGLGLLAFTGTAGENTDLFAHLAGFVAGFGAGAGLAAALRPEWLRSRAVQRACAAAALAILAAAWGVGLAARG